MTFDGVRETHTQSDCLPGQCGVRSIQVKSVALAVLLGSCGQHASAEAYFCQSEEYCVCGKVSGCSAIDVYLSGDVQQTCMDSKRTFSADVKRRRITLMGEGLSVSFREARPHFDDFDWYQVGATNERGLTNLNFDNERSKTSFLIRQMAQDSVNNFIWTLAGTCKVGE
ncbi:MAG: hypothetical protein AAFQ59_14650 [Pseudomonadota bacterium]